MKRGVLITFEGIEGSGKTTQLAIAAEQLRADGVAVLCAREPGGTAVGEGVRRVLLDAAGAPITPLAELLLFEAARAELVSRVIAPALERGEVVLCDRFADSSIAYQGFGRGLGAKLVATLNGIATSGVVPDLTLVLDLEPAVALARATAEGADRIEAEGLAFHERVRDGFRHLAAAEPQRVRLIDAAGPVDAVAARVAEALEGLPSLTRRAERNER